MLLVTVAAFGQTNINVTPDPLWSPTFDVTYLSGSAGTDLTSTQSSAVNQITINIPGLTAANANWIVSVSKADLTWNAGLTLWIARTGDGVNPSAPPPGQITGPLNTFQQITEVAAEFVRGRRTRTNVPAQLQVQGLSVLLGVRTFTTTVTFTVTEY